MPDIDTLTAVHLAWTCVLIGWTLRLVRWEIELTPMRQALRQATAEMVRRVRLLAVPPAEPEQEHADP